MLLLIQSLSWHPLAYLHLQDAQRDSIHWGLHEIYRAEQPGSRVVLGNVRYSWSLQLILSDWAYTRSPRRSSTVKFLPKGAYMATAIGTIKAYAILVSWPMFESTVFPPYAPQVSRLISSAR